MPDVWLTAADLEPPRGTVVENEAGKRWSRDYDDEGAWIREGDWWRDPASWATVAGDGRVRVVWRPAYALTDEQVAEVMRVSASERRLTVPDLAWHYGPTETDPDPGKIWHDGCGKEVGYFDGAAVCACGAQDEDAARYRPAQYDRERAVAVELAHRAMATSYIGAPPPGLRGAAGRMVAALLKAGWTPPGGAVVEHAVRMSDGDMCVRSVHPAVARHFPLEQWILAMQDVHRTAVYKRRVIVVDDWTEVPRG